MGVAFERIVIVMLENSFRDDVFANPYMADLRKKGVFLSNSMGVTHPSQPNYILSIGGDTFGICDDSSGYVQWVQWGGTGPVTSIVDLLEAQITWRAYAEGLPSDYTTQAPGYYTQNYLPAEKQAMANNVWPVPVPVPPPPPSPPWFPSDEGNFARKHVPFLSFPNIVTDTQRLANIVDGAQFEIDLANGNLPNYSWYTPDLINDGHNAPTGGKGKDNDAAARIQNIANFLQTFLSDDPIAKFPPETLIVITFDEAYPYNDAYDIYTLLIGDMLPAGTTRTAPYNHYSMLRSVEVNFGLGTLNRNDATARPYWFLRE